MIVTLTPNPSIDLTLTNTAPLARGQVQRLSAVESMPGGKGINVSHALRLAGKSTVAIFPCDPNDSFIRLVTLSGIPHQVVPTSGAVRINTTVTEPDGTTTKFNGPGPALRPREARAVENALVDAAGDADWIVISGSLPPGAPDSWYPRLIAAVRKHLPHVKVAVDTSDKPLAELAASIERHPADLMKPNEVELGQMLGIDGLALEYAAAAGDWSPVVAAGRQLHRRGVSEVLITLGPAGAALVTGGGCWVATPPPVTVLSTVGAGDCTLAGYLMARTDGADEPTALRKAVAYGSAAAALPGTAIPSPGRLDEARATVIPLNI